MSRIGKKYITMPQKVKVTLERQKISVDGPKGSLFRILPSVICCTLDEENNRLLLEKAEDTKLAQALYGLSRTLVANMVTGVSDGFSKTLQISFGDGTPSWYLTKELLFSSLIISIQSSTHSSQIKTVGPAISFLTSCWLFPQKEQYRIFLLFFSDITNQ